MPAGKFDQELVCKYEVVRTSLNTSFATAVKRDGEATVAFMKKVSPKFSLMDSTFCVEVSFFQAINGVIGSDLIKSLALAALPTEEKNVSTTQALQVLMSLQAKDVYKFVADVGQNSVQTIIDLISAVESGAAPDFGTNPSEFLIKAKEGITNFCRVINGKKDLVGIHALRHYVKLALDKKPEDVTLADLKEPIRFSFLLDAADKEKIQERRKLVVIGLKKTVTSAADRAAIRSTASGSASSSAAPSSAKLISKKTSSEISATLSMFSNFA